MDRLTSTDKTLCATYAVLGLAALVFLWVYVVLTFAVAISVALPAFLIARQVHLAGQRSVRPA